MKLIFLNFSCALYSIIAIICNFADGDIAAILTNGCIMWDLFVYQVILDGNKLVMQHALRAPCFRKCISLARNKHNYVELWYVDGNGSRSLVRYWN